ncbi:MAG: hypothetical protein EAZ60_09095 [Oscillatoriales cyanobacterium]|nr:MAG: hypothetical protein EAZ83_02330 [Oscillatoriales cyanobacterium]TAE96355.1 MAG: hypothetical protein EAZ79_14700 [Oscillatoriales cyanobacterium]TAF22392.1 MAG: hypothetical protein EAZ73_05830 [Oscillatoriales cyanobacterium]TAF31119.1 MAG: hypothetical protein EAZ69_20210 [Oscillatoriales cyanobacterium]TAF56711.1 MAG: hypothetical protein EAZ60_09095 [Oscillatoriales cyanobacterium]
MDQRGMSKVESIGDRADKNCQFFLTVHPRLRGKILLKRFCGRSAATINMSHYQGKSQVSLQS